MTYTRSLAFEAPHVRAAVDAIAAGEPVDERTLRAALHQLRQVRNFIERRGAPGLNGALLAELDVLSSGIRAALEADPPASKRRCACGRRARFGAYCARCAELAGVRPRGKVGE